MPMPHARLGRLFLVLGAIFGIGTVGYRLIEGSTWWDAFFMTVITLTTVGYGEEIALSETGEAFTTVLLLAGCGLLLFLATEVSRSVIEGELTQFLGRARRSRMIEHMSGHDIVCGYGRMGAAVVQALQRAGRRVVVIERQPEVVQALQESGVPAMSGDGTSEAVLTAAKVQVARGLVACLDDDAHNVYAVLTARSLNPTLLIAARATEECAMQRLRRAGADRVVNPYQLGGARLADIMAATPCDDVLDSSVADTAALDRAS